MCQSSYPIEVNPTQPSSPGGGEQISSPLFPKGSVGKERVIVRLCFVIFGFSSRGPKMGHPPSSFSHLLSFIFLEEDKGGVIFHLPLFFLAGQMKKSDHLLFGRKLIIVFHCFFSILHDQPDSL